MFALRKVGCLGIIASSVATVLLTLFKKSEQL